MITIINTPAANSSLQDDLWHVAISDNSGQTDFKYVYDVYVGGINKATIKQFPEPTTGKSFLNVGAIVRNTITYDWFDPIQTVYGVQPSASGEIAQTYQIQYGEDFSGITTFNLASGNTKAYNWRAPLFKRRIEDISSKLNKYVTNRPLLANDSGNDLFVGFYATSQMVLTLKTYGGTNNLLTTVVDATGVTAAGGFVELNISQAALITRLGLAANYFSNTKYYEVLINGEIFTVNIVCDGLYTHIPLHFMNAWGMFDTAVFGLVSKLNMEVERKTFNQRAYTFGSTTVDYKDGNVYRETKINYAQRFNHTYRITMDAPTDAEYEWLSELIVSPQIYAEVEGYYYPVTIKNTNYEYSTILNNKLRPLELEIELNQPRQSHAR